MEMSKLVMNAYPLRFVRIDCFSQEWLPSREVSVGFWKNEQEPHEPAKLRQVALAWVPGTSTPHSVSMCSPLHMCRYRYVHCPATDTL